MLFGVCVHCDIMMNICVDANKRKQHNSVINGVQAILKRISCRGNNH